MKTTSNLGWNWVPVVHGILLLLVNSLWAQSPLVQYSFTDCPANSTIFAPPDAPPTHVSATFFMRGPGLGPSSAGGLHYLSSSGYHETDFPAALAAGDYYCFVLTPAHNGSLTVTNLSFVQGISSTGPTQWGLFTSRDNFSNAVTSGTARVNTPPVDAVCVTLGPAFNNLKKPLELRLVGINGSGSGYASIDTVRVHGFATGNGTP